MPCETTSIKQYRDEPLIKTVQQAKMAAKILLLQRKRRKLGGVEHEWVFKGDLAKKGFKFSSINSFVDRVKKRTMLKLLSDSRGMVKAIKFNVDGERRAEEELKELWRILTTLFQSALK